MSKTLVKLARAFMEEPVTMRDGDVYRHVDTQDLEVTPGLKQAIAAWDMAYQRTFNSNYPPDSRFPSPRADRAHLQEGSRLARALQAELGDGFIVDYSG